MNAQNIKYFKVPINKNNHLFKNHSVSRKKFLTLKKTKIRKTKYIYCFLFIFIFLLVYLIFYFIYIKNKSKNVSTFNKKIYEFTKNYDKKLLKEIQRVFDEKNKVNINEIEDKYNLLEKQTVKVNSTVHVAFTLDPGYILETMLTISSILVSQKRTTKIIFHLGVIYNFTAEYMIKMYDLKNRLNNLTVFNFYYLKEAITKMKHFHKKGPACPGKFELPELISDDVGRILLFDAGDLLVLRDLTELYNYKMGDKWVLGTAEPFGLHLLKRYKIKAYVNIGSILLNINELKKNNFWDKYTKNRHL